MSEAPERVPPTRAAEPGTNAGPGEELGRYSVPQAARLLGISERAVRKRITAGTLDAHKAGTAWVVLLPATMGAVPRSVLEEPAVPGAVPESGPGPDRGGTTVPAVDLAPLVSLIEKKDAEIRQLTDATMAWQFRALRAEERLAALESGPIASPESSESANATVAADFGPQRDETRETMDLTLSQGRAAPQPAGESLVRRWWRRVTGG
jgi:hypothetical protein